MPVLNPSYPDSFGAHHAAVFYHTGPTSYTRITTGPLANGDTVRVVEAGMKSFDKIVDGTTDTGNFAVEAIPAAANAKSTTNPNGQSGATVVLRWVSRVTAVVGGQAQTAGTEAAAGTNLSTENVRLMAFGRY